MNASSPAPAVSSVVAPLSSLPDFDPRLVPVVGVDAHLPAVPAAAQTPEALRRKLFQVEFLATHSGELMVCLVYHRPLGDEWVEAAQAQGMDVGLDFHGRVHRPMAKQLAKVLQELLAKD